MNVLMVDDSRATRLAVRHWLRELAFQVTEATDGSEGLACLKKGTKFDLMLVDWEMPGLSGLEFIRAVRADTARNQAPIILMGERSSHQHLVQAMDAGANEYLMKPFTKEVLATKLDLLGIEHK